MLVIIVVFIVAYVFMSKEVLRIPDELIDLKTRANQTNVFESLSINLYSKDNEFGLGDGEFADVAELR